MSVQENENLTKLAHGLFKAFLRSSSFVMPLNEYMKQTPEGLGVPPPPLQLPYDDTMKVIDLPRPKEITVKPVDLRLAIEGRRSVRNYSDEALRLKELSWLLWCTQGVKELRRDRPATLRTVPSGGSRHPFETYMLINRVEGLDPGIYRFLALEHKLIELRTSEGLNEEIARACGVQRFIANSAVVFFWAFVPYRAVWRYGWKVYKVFFEVGHICQNLYLGAEAVDCGVCAIGAFDLDEIHRILGIAGDDQFVVYMAALGKKK